jgi:hypothetical protein
MSIDRGAITGHLKRMPDNRLAAAEVAHQLDFLRP